VKILAKKLEIKFVVANKQKKKRHVEQKPTEARSNPKNYVPTAIK
jgi:hypothetical protein